MIHNIWHRMAVYFLRRAVRTVREEDPRRRILVVSHHAPMLGRAGNESDIPALVQNKRNYEDV